MRLFEVYSRKFDLDIMRVNTSTFISESEYDINVEEAELRFACESVTEEEQSYLLEAAEDGFFTKIKNAIIKIFQSLRDFAIRTKAKLLDKFGKKEIKDVKSNEKVEMKDYDKKDKAIDESLKEVDRLIMKAKKGALEEDEIEEAKTSHKARIAAITATIMIGVSVVASRIKKQKEDLNKLLEIQENSENGIAKQLVDIAISKKDKKMASMMVRLSEMKASLQKEKTMNKLEQHIKDNYLLDKVLKNSN